MKVTITTTHSCGHVSTTEITWKGNRPREMYLCEGERGGEATAIVTPREEAEIIARRMHPTSEPCRECQIAERPHEEALVLNAAIAAGGRLARDGRMFWRFGSGEVRVGGDVAALAVLAGGRVYVTTPPQGDHPYYFTSDACKALGYKRERSTFAAQRKLEAMIAEGRREGWRKFRAAMAELWPGEVVVTFRAQTDDGYYRLIYCDGVPQAQIDDGHRDATVKEMEALTPNLDAARAEAARLK